MQGRRQASQPDRSTWPRPLQAHGLVRAEARDRCPWRPTAAAERPLVDCAPECRSFPRKSRLLVIRIEQLEPRPALELVDGKFVRRRVDVALAGLAQEPGLDHQLALRRDLLAALLEENAADRRFSGRERK